MLKAVVIGLGKQNTEDHIPALASSKKVEIVGLVDNNLEKKEIAKKYGVPFFIDHVKAFDYLNPDIAVVAVPHNEYKKIMSDAAQRKIHVLKEKPFAINLEEANYFYNLAKENNILIMTMVQRRFNPIYQTFFQLKKYIGKKFATDITYNLFINNCHEGWRGNKEIAGGGCIIDMGYHMIDMIIWYYGLPDSVYAVVSNKAKSKEVYDAEDTANIIFQYDDGFHGTLKLSRFYPPKTEHIRLVGDEGYIDVERGKIVRCKNDGEVLEQLERSKSWNVAAIDQIDYFCELIEKNIQNDNYLGSPIYHFNHVAFVEACYLSEKQKMIIKPKKLLHKIQKKIPNFEEKELII